MNRPLRWTGTLLLAALNVAALAVFVASGAVWPVLAVAVVAVAVVDLTVTVAAVRWWVRRHANGEHFIEVVPATSGSGYGSRCRGCGWADTATAYATKPEAHAAGMDHICYDDEL